MLINEGKGQPRRSTLGGRYPRRTCALGRKLLGSPMCPREGVQINPNMITLIQGELELGQSFHDQLESLLDPGYSVFSGLHLSSQDLTSSIPSFWSGGSKVEFVQDFSVCQQASLVLDYPCGNLNIYTYMYSEFWIQIFLDPLPEVITNVSYKNTVLNTGCAQTIKTFICDIGTQRFFYKLLT